MAKQANLPPRQLKVKHDPAVARGVRWRSAEARREAKRKIEAIRRKAEQERLEMGTRLDARVLRSPKVVVALLAGLLLIGGVLVGRARVPVPQEAKKTQFCEMRARRSVLRLAEAMTLFRVHTKAWPPQRLGLFALARNYRFPGWRGPYINWAYKDPWGTPYVYRMPISPYQAPILFSCGPDGQPDTNDDIRAREEDFVCSEGTWRAEPVEEPAAREAQ